MSRKRTRTATASNTVIGYVRVSTDDQSLSVDTQHAAIAAWCATHGYALLSIHEDVGVSGGAKLDKRPGLLAALDALLPGSILVATKRDRIARDAMAAAMIERRAERAGTRAAHGLFSISGYLPVAPHSRGGGQITRTSDNIEICYPNPCTPVQGFTSVLSLKASGRTYSVC